MNGVLAAVGLFVILCVVNLDYIMASNAGNNKACAQCESVFKKNHKCMNCQVCKYWFCLDCSHISVKLYDVLKNEPTTKNLPFNCDGCTRVLPKLNEFGSALQAQNKQIGECEKKVDALKMSIEKTVSEKVEDAINQYREREDRKCNIILHNIPEPVGESQTKKEDDKKSIMEVFDTIECREVQIVHHVRIGTPGNRSRLIKVQLGSVSEKHRVLGGTKLLRAKQGGDYAHRWSKVFITPDQTKEEREKSIKLKRELERRRNEGNKNLVIYRGEIVERKNTERAVAEGAGGGSRTSPSLFRK